MASNYPPWFKLRPLGAGDPTNLYLAVGKAIAEWSNVENSLAFAFAKTIGGQAQVGFKVFHSARAFAGKRDMMEAAIKGALVSADTRSQLELAFFRSCLRKVNSWATVRNRLAHNRVETLEIHGKPVCLIGPADNYRDYITSNYLTCEAIEQCSANFSELNSIISEGFCKPDLHKELRQKVLQLPNPPFHHSLECLLAEEGDEPRPSPSSP